MTLNSIVAITATKLAQKLLQKNTLKRGTNNEQKLGNNARQNVSWYFSLISTVKNWSFIT